MKLSVLCLKMASVQLLISNSKIILCLDCVLHNCHLGWYYIIFSFKLYLSRSLNKRQLLVDSILRHTAPAFYFLNFSFFCHLSQLHISNLVEDLLLILWYLTLLTSNWHFCAFKFNLIGTTCMPSQFESFFWHLWVSALNQNLKQSFARKNEHQRGKSLPRKDKNGLECRILNRYIQLIILNRFGLILSDGQSAHDLHVCLAEAWQLSRLSLSSLCNHACYMIKHT